MVAQDYFKRAPASSASYTHAFPIAENDTDEVGAYFARAVYVGTTGDLHVETSAGDEVTFTAVPAGTLLPVAVRKVFVDSTAGAILGLY